MKRRVAREKALQTLFQYGVNDIEPREALENVLDGAEMDEFLLKLVDGTLEHMSEIDQIINDNLENWSINRLAKVDLTILRLGINELLYNDEIPDNVAINEAIEIAKKFGDEHSSKFVNGILSKVKEQKKNS